MSEHEDELKKALAANGNFDPERADRVAADVVYLFDRRLKWLARITWLRTLILFAVVEIGCIGLLLSFSTKGMIGFAALLLLGIGALCVVDLQYRIMNAKVSLLKEIKQLRLEYVGRPTAQGGAPAQESGLASTNLWRTPPLSLREDMTWYVLMILVAAVIAFPFWLGIPRVSAPTVESYVILAPDGSGTEVMKVSYPYFGWVPRVSFPFTTTDANASIRWVDGQGRELQATVSTSVGQRHYTVRLVEPVMPGGQVTYTQFTETRALAARKDGLWTYRKERAFGAEKQAAPPPAQLVVGSTLVDTREPKVVFAETVQLPRGAEFIKGDRDAYGGGTWNGTTARIFKATRSRNEAFTYVFQYRLPDVTNDAETTK